MNYYVYMMKAGGYIKIGVSKAPEKRRESMQTGNPHLIEIVARFPFNSKAEAFDFENMLHKRLRDYNYRGEWFRSGCIGLALKRQVRGVTKIPHRERKKLEKEKDPRWEFEYDAAPDRSEIEIVLEANKRI